MKFTLGKDIKVGQKVLTSTRWEKVLKVGKDGVDTKGGFIEFGYEIYGWKLK